MFDAAVDSQEIIITAARAPEEEARTPASVTVITDRRIRALGEPLLPTLLRLTPSVAVATSGPAGSLTEVRIRGAESNHTLLFVDGIRLNDPAAGNQPRFELLNADIASRVEVVRGPQSALWGSEAIGGVVAVNGLGADATGLSAMGEAGSLAFRRSAASASLASGRANLAAALGYQRSRGIDAFDGTGDRDGYRNLSGRLRGEWNPAPSAKVGLAAVGLSGRSEFDGYSPVTFLRDDTLDSSRNRLLAGRLWAAVGGPEAPWSGYLATSLLGSTNRNLLKGEEINRTRGQRWTVAGQVQRRFLTGGIAHQLILAADHEREEFRARDTVYGGFSNQDRTREHQAVTAELSSQAGRFTSDLAVRHDRFDSFNDATTVRAGVLADLGQGFALAGSYGEGIAQPTFFDLYGFFPGSFIGNPDLAPESSRGMEASLRFRRQNIEAGLTLYRQWLEKEIVDTFDPVTFLSSTANRQEESRRRGIEAQVGWQRSEALRLTGHYAFLDAEEPSSTDGDRLLREVRRPRHSGSVAADGIQGKLSYGAALAYSGKRIDTDFDVFPARRVTLGSYWLASARVGYAVRPGVEIFARASNAFDERYEEVVGNRIEGRTVYGGIRFAGGR